MNVSRALSLCLPILLSAAIRSARAQEPADTLRVPAYTAYSEPDPEALQFSAEQGITGWTDRRQAIAWYGNIHTPGPLTIAIVFRDPAPPIPFRLTVRRIGASRPLLVRTIAARSGMGTESRLDFGQTKLAVPGAYRFALEAAPMPGSKAPGGNLPGKDFGSPDALVLGGPAARSAQFNLTERKNAASVHLRYPLPAGLDVGKSNIAWFYNEVEVHDDPVWSYFMACGFRRGYFGIQVNSPTERRIIFSVWDSGNEAVDRAKVAAEDRVQLVAKHPDAFADSFGNEGTGGHSHLVYSWKPGTTYRFLVSAQPDGTHTVYSGYFYFPERNRWELIASFRAPRDGGYLSGLYSFNENFGGANGELRRFAAFGAPWIKTTDGRWIALSTAQFTYDGHGKVNRKDYGAGTRNGRFYLSNGGFVADPVQYGEEFHLPASSAAPPVIELPSASK